MQRIRECIYRLRLNQSLRQISKDLHIHRRLLRNIRNIAFEKDWLNPATLLPDDHILNQAFPYNSKLHSSLFDSYHEQIKEWKTLGYSAVVIHKLLQEKVPASISQVRRYLKQISPKIIEPVMVRQTSPGEVMEVDFGFLGYFFDVKEDRFRKTWVFSARLRHSRKAYREVVVDQTTLTFIKCHIHAFEWFGGVPVKVVLDNLKAGVIKSCIDNDGLNRSYMEMAEYYGVLIDPCLPGMPRHKGGVENDIGYIKKNFLPIIREKQKLYPRLDLYALQQELEKWDREIADVRIIHGTFKSPFIIFSEEEKTALKNLQKSRWDIVQWHQCEVRKEWRVMYDGAYYSVPYFLIGQTVQVMSTSSQVRIFFEHNQVASHKRATKKWEYLRNTDHAPPFKEMVLSCTREGLLIQAEEIGPHTLEIVKKILDHPASDKLRPVRKLLQLALNYSKERIEKACERALHFNTLRYQSVKHILENGLEEEQFKNQKSKVYPLFKHARDPKEYNIKPTIEENSNERDRINQ